MPANTTKVRTRAAGRKTKKKTKTKRKASSNRVRESDDRAPCLSYTAVKLTARELAHNLSTRTYGLGRRRICLSSTEATAIVNDILSDISDSLVEGRSVSLLHVGTMYLQHRAGSRYRHPETGKIRTAKPRWHVKFKEACRLRKLLDKKD